MFFFFFIYNKLNHYFNIKRRSMAFQENTNNILKVLKNFLKWKFVAEWKLVSFYRIMCLLLKNIFHDDNLFAICENYLKYISCTKERYIVCAWYGFDHNLFSLKTALNAINAFQENKCLIPASNIVLWLEIC